MALVLGALVSGRGSNLQAILDHIGEGKIDARVAVVISDKKNALALQRAQAYGVPAIHMNPKSYSSRVQFDNAVADLLGQHGVELVVLAGYMRIVTPEFIRRFQGRIMNIHPSLLPAFPGTDAQAQALAYGVKIAGCTVHFVDEGTDTGPIIIQAAVPVLDDDTVETLAGRILEQEHTIYSQAIQLFAGGKLVVGNRRVRIKEAETMAVRRALISVSDKTGLVEFAKGLVDLGVEIVSTGGTMKLLKDSGLPVTYVSDVTGFPEILDGRVKTLHPAIHAGILALRNVPAHMEQLAKLGLAPIDLVVVNLYPFEQVASRPGSTFEEVIENIDIGGPSMLRAAAKNFENVAVVVNPGDYEVVLSELRTNGEISKETKFRLAVSAFQHTGRYDRVIFKHLSRYLGRGVEPAGAGEAGAGFGSFPEVLSLDFDKVQDLRYGENPHQRAAFYREPGFGLPCITNAKQLHGKELSFNNINDANAAIELLREFPQPAAVAVKHANPCGVGCGTNVEEAYIRAYEADPVSIFGGIVAMNRPVDAVTARRLVSIFLEIVIAPGFGEDALAILRSKKDLRVMILGNEWGGEASGILKASGVLDMKRVVGGLLIQDLDVADFKMEDALVVTKRQPTEKEWADLLFAWKVAKHVKSNAIVLANGLATAGIGAGQMNRVGAAKIAIEQAGPKAKGSCLGSDAFFPMRDTVDEAGKAGVSAIIQPGGSIKDAESIAACDEYGIAMVFTGMRHFKH